MNNSSHKNEVVLTEFSIRDIAGHSEENQQTTDMG